jgi:hypothetical protein
MVTTHPAPNQKLSLTLSMFMLFGPFLTPLFVKGLIIANKIFCKRMIQNQILKIIWLVS